MTLVLHNYIVLICKQTPIKHGFQYEKADIDLSMLAEDEVYKLMREVREIKESLEECIWNESWKTSTIEASPTTSISGAVVEDKKEI